MDSKLFKSAGIAIGVFIVIIFLLFGIASCSGGGTTIYTYETLQEEMLEIAKEYYEENPKELPSEDTDTKTYTLKKMISEEKLDEVPILFGNEEMKCDGSVTVTNNNGYFIYSPYLNCSAGKKEKYETISLADKIKEDSLTTEGYGLYQVGDQYYSRGEIENNFIKFPGSDKLYRIVGINADGTIRLIQLDVIRGISWDNRYNIEFENNDGINEYFVNNIDSRLKESLKAEYNDKESWPDEYKALITTQKVCVGKRSEDDESTDGSIECSKTIDDQLGVLAVYEVLRASLDENCIATVDYSCSNYNWMTSLGRSTWLSTADSNSSRYAFKFDGNSIIKSKTYTTSNVFPVFNIYDKAIYQSGTGTEEDPYVIYMEATTDAEIDE